jgi:hypothetical protein
VKLDQERAAGLELAVAAGVEEAAIRPESVTGCIDRLGRVSVVSRVVLFFRQIRKVRDDQIDGMRDRLEQIALQDVDTVLDTVEARVLTCELDCSRVRVGRPNLDVRAVDREGDRDRPAARADVGDAHRDAVDSLESLIDQALRRRPRREDLAGRSEEWKVVEGRFHKL